MSRVFMQRLSDQPVSSVRTISTLVQLVHDAYHNLVTSTDSLAHIPMTTDAEHDARAYRVLERIELYIESLNIGLARAKKEVQP